MYNKTYREQLNVVQENNLSITDIIIGAACDALFDFRYTEEEFEHLCCVASKAYLATADISEDDIAATISELVDCGYSIDEICELSKWDLLDYVIDGIPEYEDEVEGD